MGLLWAYDTCNAGSASSLLVRLKDEPAPHFPSRHGTLLPCFPAAILARRGAIAASPPLRVLPATGCTLKHAAVAGVGPAWLARARSKRPLPPPDACCTLAQWRRQSHTRQGHMGTCTCTYTHTHIHTHILIPVWPVVALRCIATDSCSGLVRLQEPLCARMCVCV